MSLTKEATTTASAKPFNGEDMANKKLLGVRVHFPIDPYNSWAMISPPFDIPAYADKTGPDGITVAAADKGVGAKFENGYGVVKNVGVLKSLSITVYGSNFPNGLGVDRGRPGRKRADPVHGLPAVRWMADAHLEQPQLRHRRAGTASSGGTPCIPRACRT